MGVVAGDPGPPSCAAKPCFPIKAMRATFTGAEGAGFQKIQGFFQTILQFTFMVQSHVGRFHDINFPKIISP